MISSFFYSPSVFFYIVSIPIENVCERINFFFSKREKIFAIKRTSREGDFKMFKLLILKRFFLNFLTALSVVEFVSFFLLKLIAKQVEIMKCGITCAFNILIEKASKFSRIH